MQKLNKDLFAKYSSLYQSKKRWSHKKYCSQPNRWTIFI